MKPSIGRIVLYTLNAADAQAINKRRSDFEEYRKAHRSTTPSPGLPGATGHIGHLGNHAEAGQEFPAQIVRVFHPTVTTANLQVALDGNDHYWVTSVQEGEGPGSWRWPPRV
jgi:hypothetical protein